jgi:hypothetical protein
MLVPRRVVRLGAAPALSPLSGLFYVRFQETEQSTSTADIVAHSGRSWGVA